ncbi:MAG: c-type cytochrome [Alphaproteobacteria bacterium]|nr:c-type cytochrome [Alphaproteobacteria bacterium]
MTRFKLLALTVLASVALASGSALAAGDAAKGKKGFNRCKACHALEVGKNKTGPNLAGLFGRTAGSVEKYKYSKDLKAAGEKGLKWDEEQLMVYLKDPTAFLKSYLGKDKVTNKMKNKFPKESLRANIIAYLQEATK